MVRFLNRRTLRHLGFGASRVATWWSGKTKANCILMYHGHQVGVPVGVDPSEFEDQMVRVREGSQTALLRELPRLLSEDADQLVSLTFDDGLVDNYEVSLATLEKMGLKGTFFLIPGLLGGTLATQFGDQPILSASQAREVAALGHEIGAHTMSHQNLAACSAAVARREIVESKQALEDLIGTEITSFAYPYGSCTPMVRTVVRQAGFRLAVGTREGHLTIDPDWLELPRLALFQAVTPELFQMKLSPAWPTYVRMRQRWDRQQVVL